MSAIQQLAEQVGFHNEYTNCFGQQVYAEDESRASLLNAMGYDVSSEDIIYQQIETLKNSQWLRLIAPTEVIKEELSEPVVDIVLNENEQKLQYQVEMENGELVKGNVSVNDSDIESQKTIDKQSYRRVTLKLPKMPMGYHTLTVNSGERVATSTLIVAPQKCYQPSDAAAFKMWGLAAQVYSLRHSTSIGMGDFSALKRLVEQAGQKGASLIGVNPLHPLFPSNPAHRSPYSPSSRNFWNVMYLDPRAFPNFSDCKAVQEALERGENRTLIEQLNSQEHIDYAVLGRFKLSLFELLFKDFQEKHLSKNSALAQAFQSFRIEQGKDLDILTTYEALYEHFHQLDRNAYGWRDWPEDYQSPTTPAVKAFAEEFSDRIDFFAFLQWNADRQLTAIKETAERAGMPVGLYLDLAVGSDGGGADVWSNREVYVAGGAVGAPPDATNTIGQDWGLTPINPVALKEQGFQALIKPMRSCMRHAGALRIDHVLGYMRQYWVAPGKRADEGIYISFPFEDMLRVIALESQRSRCIVIGEDLGTVPEGFGEIMANAGLLSYRVLFFERWESGLFHRPEVYPEQAMVTVSTHDLPTVHGWWSGEDLNWRDKLKLYPNQEMGVQQRAQRISDREQLLAALDDAQVIAKNEHPSTHPPEMNIALARAVQSFLAKTKGAIQMIPLEDALGIEQQVNIPGTIDEHPNWLQRLSLSVDALWQHDYMQAVIETMNQQRPRS